MWADLLARRCRSGRARLGGLPVKRLGSDQTEGCESSGSCLAALVCFPKCLRGELGSLPPGGVEACRLPAGAAAHRGTARGEQGEGVCSGWTRRPECPVGGGGGCNTGSSSVGDVVGCVQRHGSAGGVGHCDGAITARRAGECEGVVGVVVRVVVQRARGFGRRREAREGRVEGSKKSKRRGRRLKYCPPSPPLEPLVLLHTRNEAATAPAVSFMCCAAATQLPVPYGGKV